MVPSDFSDSSLPAIRYAVELAKPFEAEVVGCHVIEPATAILPGMKEESMDVVASRAREHMEQLLADADADEFRVLIEHGNACRNIVRLARNEDVDLIVITTHGRSGLSHVLMGSTAENIVRLAPCPVLVTREGTHDFVHPTTD